MNLKFISLHSRGKLWTNVDRNPLCLGFIEDTLHVRSNDAKRCQLCASTSDIALLVLCDAQPRVRFIGDDDGRNKTACIVKISEVSACTASAMTEKFT